jgi:hypothetical protein
MIQLNSLLLQLGNVKMKYNMTLDRVLPECIDI